MSVGSRSTLLSAEHSGDDKAAVAETGARSDGSGLLAVGFGTSVVMWTVGYICRFPGVSTPSWLLLCLLLLCLVSGGYIAGRVSNRPLVAGLLTGLIAATLNLLVLGSLLSGSEPGTIVPSALWWLPGSLLVSSLLGGLGATLGRSQRSVDTTWFSHNGVAALAVVGTAATFLLLIVGGIVTGSEAGLAVVDWPNSYGYNMFLYPLSRMTGGIYYEHGHRLLGALVGLTTVVLALQLYRVEPRRWLWRLGLFAVVMVALQGILGGLRVTGHFTLSSDPAVTRPSIWLAVTHGVLGQLFFATMVAIAVFISAAWTRTAPAQIEPAAATDRGLTRIFAAVLVVQLVLGALVRHVSGGLMIHMTMAVVVILAGLAVGIRAWGRNAHYPELRLLGKTLLALLLVQLILGMGALVAIGVQRSNTAPPPLDIALTTAHQGTGALLLACAVALVLWTQHRLRPE